MTDTATHQQSGPASESGTVAQVMQPAITTVEKDAHVAAAAYLMKRAGATAIVVIDNDQTKRPLGILTEADIVRVVADGKDVNDLRINEMMTSEPTVCQETTTIRDAARRMMASRIRHLPVVEDDALVGIVDISDLSRALLGPAS
jgi:CBS domain-containing protein